MATAPSAATANRARRRAQKASTGETSIRLTWRGRPLEFTLSDLGPADDLICRQQTGGYAFTGLVAQLQNGDKLGSDIVATILWMARRKNGEPGLTLEQVFEEVGSMDQMMKDLQLSAGDGEPAPYDPGAPRGETGPEAEPPGT